MMIPLIKLYSSEITNGNSNVTYQNDEAPSGQIFLKNMIDLEDQILFFLL